jgi:hypothetical protein
MKVVRLVFSIFFVIGVGLLIGCYFMVRHTQHFLQTAIPVRGVVVENVYRESSGNNNNGPSWSYYPHVQFRTTDGQAIDFVSSTGSSPPSYSVNQPVTVLYDPQQPYKASINSFGQLWVGPLVLGILGVVFTAPGIGFMVWKRFSDQKNAWLRQNGRRILAEITIVELNTSLEVNGRNPFRIVCQWLDPARNEMHVFHSSNIWYDPTQFITEKTLEVLVDPDNPRRYSVDTSFLPKVV